MEEGARFCKKRGMAKTGGAEAGGRGVARPGRGLDASRMGVPLPEDGSTTLRRAGLTARDRERLEGYLDKSQMVACAPRRRHACGRLGRGSLKRSCLFARRYRGEVALQTFMGIIDFAGNRAIMLLSSGVRFSGLFHQGG